MKGRMRVSLTEEGGIRKSLSSTNTDRVRVADIRQRLSLHKACQRCLLKTTQRLTLQATPNLGDAVV